MSGGRGQGPEDAGPGADQVTLSGSRAAEDHPEDPARSECAATRRVAAASLLCDRPRDHRGLHFDELNMLWWAGQDNRMVSTGGLVS